MSSARKTAANGRNAKKSKGPRTVEGRNVARRNALKHGLTAETLVVEGEDADEFRFTADAHGAVFRPRNDVEVELVRTFTIAAWRRQRCASTETAMVNRYIRDSQLAEEVIEQQDALALGDRLFFDSQDLWQLYPDPTMNGAPLSKRRNEVPGSPDLPARLVNELESTSAGCRWLLDRWNDLKTRNQPFNNWQASDKFKAIRLLGKQPLDVLHDTTGDLMAVFLGSYAVYPQNKSPFSELRCELGDDQFPAVRRQLEVMDIERRLPVGETAGRQLLDDLIARRTRRLEQLALKHKARAEAEAAESTRRLAFDPGAAADKVRRYEDASIRRMTRACEDLAKLRRSGILDEDADVEPGLPDAPRGRDPSSSGELLGDSADLDRCEQPESGAGGESSGTGDEGSWDAPPPMSETTVAGWLATVHAERLGSGENTDRQPDAPQEASGSPAAVQAPETTVDGPRSTFNGNSGQWNALLLLVCFLSFAGSERLAAFHGGQLRPSQVKHHAERDDCSDCRRVTAHVGTTRGESIQITLHDSGRASLPASRSPRRRGRTLALPGTRMLINTGVRRPTRSEAAARNEATAICGGRAGSADRLTVAAPTGNARGVSVHTGEQRLTRGETSARIKATAIGSDSAEYSALIRLAQFREGEPPGEPFFKAARPEPRPPRIKQGHSAGSARMRQTRNTAFRDRSVGFRDVQEANHEEGRKPGRAQSGLFPPSCLPQIVIAAFG
ncbi:MAG: hypothetical protein ACLQIB_29150 [Isosphaeraceae bacterium]